MRALLTYILALPIVFAVYLYAPVEGPAPIHVSAPTPESMQAQFDRESKQKAYDRAEEVAAHVMRMNGCSDEYAEAVGQAAVDNSVSPRILASLAYVESSCRADAVSGAKSVGLTQVNPKAWHYTTAELMNPYRNAQIGAHILATYTRRYGVKEGLHRYNGLGDKSESYSRKVLTAAGYAS